MFKTKPYAHQKTGFDLAKDRDFFAFFMEQGTGKSKVSIDIAAYRFGKGHINALFIVAPNGVHSNWVINEIPTHLHDAIKTRVALWTASTSKKKQKEIEALYDVGIPTTLRIFVMNIDAFTTKRGCEQAERFLRTFSVAWVLDESTRIKEPKAQRTKAVLRLSTLAKIRLILTGTPVTQSPLDVFTQMSFLDPWILKTQSFYAFKARYAQLLTGNHGLLRHIKERVKLTTGKDYTPQIVERDAQGRPIYRNIDKLQQLIAPHSYRVLKSECLDLPEKVYQRVYCDLEQRQKELYRTLRKDLRLKLADNNLLVVTKLTLLSRLQQVVGGHGPSENGLKFDVPLFDTPTDNPRIVALLEAIAESTGGVIIWARFLAEIADITSALRMTYRDEKVVQYYGDVSAGERVEAVEAFQSGEARFFVGQQRSGGIGLTLTAAHTVVYYSNDFSLETRLQSEDRAHRIGQRNVVTYIDIEAVGTDDKKIISTLRDKKDIADQLTGDSSLPWL